MRDELKEDMSAVEPRSLLLVGQRTAAAAAAPAAAPSLGRVALAVDLAHLHVQRGRRARARVGREARQKLGDLGGKGAAAQEAASATGRPGLSMPSSTRQAESPRAALRLGPPGP